MDPLSRLFGSAARLKLLRLFIFNQEIALTLEEIIMRTKLSRASVHAELRSLIAMEIVKKKGGKKGITYSTNTSFEYLGALASFIRETSILRPAAILALLKKAGTLRLVVLSGLFTGIVDSKIDLLLVGDSLKEQGVARIVAKLESELGREIHYAFFSTADFKYRRGVYDRLIRDVLDYPHRVILDKIGL